MMRSFAGSARPRSGASRCLWLPLTVGVAAGWTAAWLLRARSGSRVGGGGRGTSWRLGVGTGASPASGGDHDSETREGRWAHWVQLLEETMDDAVDGLAGLRERLFGHEAPDLSVLEGVIERVPGAHGCRLRPLGDGIVELVGVCDEDEVAERVAAMVGAVPGVRVVVNRVWTPSSSVRIDPPGTSG